MKTIKITNTSLELLLEDYYFSINGKTQKIPAKFASDGASIPRVFFFLYRKEDKEAYWIHDFLYSQKSDDLNISKQEADYKLLRDIKNWERYPIYFGVYFFGFLSWKQDINYTKYKKVIQYYIKTLSRNIEIGKISCRK